MHSAVPFSRPIRVLIVDDSAVARRAVSDALRAEPGIEVVGTAGDPFVARDRICELKPDVLTLDLELPRMDGLTFLGILMRERPVPTIVISSLTPENSPRALEALRLGAVEVIPKPSPSSNPSEFVSRLALAVRAAATARPRPGSDDAGLRALPTTPREGIGRAVTPDPRRLILLGASTGGTEALTEVLTRLPAGLPPIAVVQHIPARFSRAFAERLDRLCALRVSEAEDGAPLRPGEALIAPGDFHLLLRPAGAGYRAALWPGPPVWHQRPAVDVLFKSVPEAAAPGVIAGVLTGMGKDGAEGLLHLRRFGAATFAQDEASSVVYGMPREAWENGGAQIRLPLESIAAHLTRLATEPSSCHAPS